MLCGGGCALRAQPQPASRPEAGPASSSTPLTSELCITKIKVGIDDSRHNTRRTRAEGQTRPPARCAVQGEVRVITPRREANIEKVRI
eukprot:6704091-Prymnesium_polylepis.1